MNAMWVHLHGLNYIAPKWDTTYIFSETHNSHWIARSNTHVSHGCHRSSVPIGFKRTTWSIWIRFWAVRENCKHVFCYKTNLYLNTEAMLSSEQWHSVVFVCLFWINFYCSENFKEAMGCFRCVESKGCQVVKGYADSLRGAAAKLCPHLQEFACPADVLTWCLIN